MSTGCIVGLSLFFVVVFVLLVLSALEEHRSQRQYTEELLRDKKRAE